MRGTVTRRVTVVCPPARSVNVVLRVTVSFREASSVRTRGERTHLTVRVAVTGRSVGPPLFESMALLGRGETLRRLRAARARLEA
jgi:glutamyl/glutaminyl-tRNA synthetase